MKTWQKQALVRADYIVRTQDLCSGWVIMLWLGFQPAWKLFSRLCSHSVTLVCRQHTATKWNENKKLQPYCSRSDER